MGLLQYTSNEMFSSTELVRKNKSIFDKLNKKEIEKAVILRDGKPNIILLDFNEYEKIIAEYLKLKEGDSNSNTLGSKNDLNTTGTADTINKTKQPDEINNIDLQNALNEIDKLDFSFDSKKVKEEKTEQLKEFWD